MTERTLVQLIERFETARRPYLSEGPSPGTKVAAKLANRERVLWERLRSLNVRDVAHGGVIYSAGEHGRVDSGPVVTAAEVDREPARYRNTEGGAG